MKILQFICILLFSINFGYANGEGIEKVIKAELTTSINADDIGYFCSLGCAMGWDLESSSNLNKQNSNSYEVKMLDDGLTSTAWIEGVPGDGIGEYILFKFPEYRFTESNIGTSMRFYGFWFLNGYTKDLTTWKNNSRVKKIRLYHNNIPLHVVELYDSMHLQYISFPVVDLRRGDSIKVEIMEVYQGDKFSDTAISELLPMGAH